MNLEDNEDYVKAIADVDYKVIDGKVYVSTAEIDRLTTVLYSTMGLLQHCKHSVQVINVFVPTLRSFTDTLNVIHAAETVPDTIPDEFLDGS